MTVNVSLDEHCDRYWPANDLMAGAVVSCDGRVLRILAVSDHEDECGQHGR
jgi:hypothetical protein